MPTLPRQIGVAVDLAGCPNRCRHCYLGVGPNETPPPEVLREAAEAFWNWSRPGQDATYFEQVDVASWYREPDFSGVYKKLYELEREFSRREPRRYELLSVWRLARDEDYARWAGEVGPRVCQISFFGLEKVNDYFFRRRGAFRDNLAATERLLEVGMIPRWQVFLTKPAMPDLEGLMDVVAELGLRERVVDLGEEFCVFCHPPAPDGEAWNIEHLRVEEPDLGLIPDELKESTRKHFGGEINWRMEAQIVEAALDGETIPPYVPEQTWFFVDANCDVFSNYGELTDAWRLGNFKEDALDAILGAFEGDASPGLWSTFHVPDGELAERFGRRDSACIYDPADARSRWIHLYCEDQANA